MTTPAELRTQIEIHGAEIALLTERIEERLHGLKNWRSTVHEYPLQSVATALGAGLVVSGVAIPAARLIGRQIGFALKASLTAYLTAVFTDKLREISLK